ncbi:sialidase family protein [Hufsiella ginkgonis]|uniref:Exo-alpha-sialidase n=1 Tax=Hufsiella ginkgonis TaxID=2695274 RepID=A0A7K1XY31_9SPHI|nr:sialidase family protein [Hufsiella ginkgonis]MXV15747.1 exo-alpha-sialidase [Hufsiella ginkgonis]
MFNFSKVAKTIIAFAIFLPASGAFAQRGDIVWDQATLVKVSSSARGERNCGYARMAQLPGGTLLAVYEADGSIVAVKSIDAGVHWGDPVTVAAKTEDTNMAVPDLLVLANNDILVCYNPRPFRIDPSRKFGIRIKISHDNGATWSAERSLYEAGHLFRDGCWEPSAIQLRSGELQLFFADEGPFTNSDEQNISMLRSLDNGRTWSPEPVVVSFRPGSRDGMPVPLLLRNKREVVFAIEDNGFRNFKPAVIRSSLKNNWSKTVGAESPDRAFALKEPLPDTIYAGAPFLRQLTTGETILCYQGTEGRRNQLRFAEMKVAIGDNRARSFIKTSNPFLIPASKSGLWNSLCILNDDTIIAITSTNAFSANGRSEVWMIKGRFRKDGPRY